MAGYTFWLRMKRGRTKTRGGRIKQSGKEKEISGVRVNLRDSEQDFGDRVSESTVTAVGDIEERLRDFIGESDGELSVASVEHTDSGIHSIQGGMATNPGEDTSSDLQTVIQQMALVLTSLASDKTTKEELLRAQEEKLAKLDGDRVMREERSKLVDRITPMKEGGEIEVYVHTLEAELIGANIPDEQWKSILLNKVPTKVKALALEDSSTTYLDIKTRLLIRGGISQTEAGIKIYSSWVKDNKGKAGRGDVKQLFALVDRYFNGCMDLRQCKTRTVLALYRLALDEKDWVTLDGKMVTTKEELYNVVDTIDALRATRRMEAEFDKEESYKDFSSRHSYLKYQGLRNSCFRCGKTGHRAFECRSGYSYGRSHTNQSNFQPRYSPTCYLCGVQGHISPECPNGSRKEKDQGYENKKDQGTDKNNKENPILVKNHRGVKNVSLVLADQHPNIIPATINGNCVDLVLDSGASISVVPESVVNQSQYTNDQVVIVGVTNDSYLANVAEIPFNNGKSVIVKEAAVVPDDMTSGCALFSLALRNAEDMKFTQVDTSSDDKKDAVPEADVLQVVTRQQKAGAAVQERAEAKTQEGDGAQAKRVTVAVAGMEQESRTSPLVGSTQGAEVSVEVVSREMVGEVLEGKGDSGECLAKVEVLPLGDEDSEERDRVVNAIGLPKVRECSDTDLLRKELLEDDTLAKLRSLGNQRARGYHWEEGILYHRTSDFDEGVVDRIVLPKCRRKKVLEIAHEGTGHLSTKKVRDILHSRFTWPYIARDIDSHCRSCETCQRSNKRGERKALMVERPVISEPFEYVAVDLVGPFPRSKNGSKYLFTYLCMASRWPDAVALKSITASTVARGLVQIFSRTGLPLQLLTDQGTQFTGKLLKELASMFNIHLTRTTPYHPQSNGLVERLHGTLESILTKAHREGHDWEIFLPLTLFALRQCPNRDTGFSPYQLIYGRNVVTPLDVVYAGWSEMIGEGMEVSEWVLQLSDRLETLRDCAVDTGLVESDKRASSYNRGKCDRQLKVGERILCRIPGLAAKLEDSWDGPYCVLEKLGGRQKVKIIHINNAKVYRAREEFVGAVTVVAEEGDFGVEKNILDDIKCEGIDETELCELLSEFDDVLIPTPGSCTIGEVDVVIEEGVTPISQAPYKIPHKIREGVREELESLLADGIIEESDAAWCSPLVPIIKPSGKIRLCVDFRKLNSVTPQVQYKIPELDDILEKVGVAQALSKLDLAKGFHQLVLRKDCRHLTTFCSPHGKFRFCKLPFGLKNAPAYFQGAMEKALRMCLEVCSVYIDDILVYSRDPKDHIGDLRKVLVALRKAGLTARPEKCEWGRKFLTYLGHRIGGGRVAVPEDRVTAMSDYKRPRTQRDMRAFLGAVGYYRRFIQNFASHSSVLTPSTSTKSPKVIQWTPAMDEAFMSLRSKLCNHVILTVPNVCDCFRVQTDASYLGLGAVLNVIRDNEELPIGFFSRQLRGAEKRYSATELEALGVVEALKHWTHLLYGQKFTVVTDHKALCYLMTSSRLNKRLRGFALSLQQFDFAVVYRAGPDNANADGLSRQAWEIEDSEEDHQEIEGIGELGSKEQKKEVKIVKKMTDVSVPSGVAPSPSGRGTRLEGGVVGPEKGMS